MSYIGNLFVISAPSGAGKSSLVKALMELDAHITLSISHTTRLPRGQETDGQDYFFVNDSIFDQMIDQSAFLEWAEVHGYRYGTSYQAIRKNMQNQSDVILEIDVQGALQVKHWFTKAILIFILPPSWSILRTRLERRGEDPLSVIEQRLKGAAIELQYVKDFDFVIINEVFETALFDLKTIVHAQRLCLPSQRLTHPHVFSGLGIPHEEVVPCVSGE